MAIDLEIKSKILSCLKNCREGASASDIAKYINHNRITIGKYLQVLEAQKLVISKKVASAIYWQLGEGSSKSKILIVDDEKHIVDLIKLCLGDQYALFEAADGEEAISKALTVLPDLVVLDLMMPKKNGYEVCEFLKNNVSTHKIPIIILSAKGSDDDKLKAFKLGANDYLVKPFDPLELDARVSSLLSKTNSQDTKNSMTGLPNSILADEIRKIFNQKPIVWYETKILISRYEDYIEEFGRKKAHELVILTSRMIPEQLGNSDANTSSKLSSEKSRSSSNFSDISSDKNYDKKSKDQTIGHDIFLGHVDDNIFVIFSKKKLSLKKDLESKFEKITPFFYSKSDSKNHVALLIEEKENKGGK